MKIKFFPSIFLLLLLTAGLWAQDYVNRPDSSSIRAGLVDSWFEKPVVLLKDQFSELYENVNGEVFQVRYEDYGAECVIVVAPERMENVEIYNSSGVQTVMQKVYPAEATGSWILIRDSATGEPKCIRWYFTGDSGVYVQLRRSDATPDEKSLADFVMFGNYTARDVPVGVPLNFFYDKSIDELMSITRYSLPWIKTGFYPEIYNDVLQMTAVIRENLDRFEYLEDAAYDEMGNLYSIKNGTPMAGNGSQKLLVSSAGFVKWIVDGLVRPLSGSGLLLSPLMEKTESYKSGSLADSMSQLYDTTLGLDWIRNLAAAMVSIYSGRDYTYGTSGVQVNYSPFNGAYLDKAGIKIEYLKSMFYYLAGNEPDRFYLGAVRHAVNNGTEFIVYNKCVAFFPAFDRNGRFTVAVFTDGEEVSIDDFMDDNKGDFIQLVRLQASEQFFPR